MIRAETRAIVGDLIRRLSAKGEALALRRARGLAARQTSFDHPWRSPQRLWPDMFKDN